VQLGQVTPDIVDIGHLPPGDHTEELLQAVGRVGRGHEIGPVEGSSAISRNGPPNP
jgi:hypothetical protein